MTSLQIDGGEAGVQEGQAGYDVLGPLRHDADPAGPPCRRAGRPVREGGQVEYRQGGRMAKILRPDRRKE